MSNPGMDVPGGRYWRRSPLAPLDICWWTILALVGSWLFFRSQDRWLDSILDVGRDLYIPTKLLEGKRLYVDFQYYYPPVAPYALAALIAVVGSDLFGYTVIGVAIAAAITLLLYLLVRALAGPTAAGPAALLFVTLNFTANTRLGCNYIFPYAHASVFGILFVLAAVFFLARYLFAGRGALDHGLAVLASLLAAWSKIELALLIVVLWIGVALWYRLGWRPLLAPVGAGLLSLGVLHAIFFTAVPGHHWIRDNILPRTHLEGSTVEAFYGTVTGVSDWKRNLGLAASGAALTLLVTLLLAALERLRRSETRGTPFWAPAAGLVTLLAVAGWFLADDRFFRGWTILQPLLAVVLLRRKGLRATPLPFLLLVSMLASLRIWLNLSPEWYGFFLIVPVYVLIAYVLFGLLPDLGLYSRRLAWMWLPVLLLLAGRSVSRQVQVWDIRSYEVISERGRFHEHRPGRAAVLRELLAWAREARPGTLVVIPESPTLNYFTHADNPTYYQMFTPIVSDHPEMEARMIEDFARTRPEYIAFVSRNVREFGYQGFGIDYNLELAAWISSHYDRIRAWTEGDFHLWILRIRE